MPNLYFIVFELLIYLQFAICLAHAWKPGPANLPGLFGVSLELATIRQLHAYQSLTRGIPSITHFYVLIAGLIAGVILNPPFLLWVDLIMTGIAFYLHRPTVSSRIKLRS